MDIENGVTMINGIKPIIKPKPVIKTEFDKPKTNGLSFDEAMDNLLVKIQESYDNWYAGTKYSSTKKLDLSLNKGRKFIKVVEGSLGQRRVWGFVSLVDGTHKGMPLKKGDIMKAAGWSGVAKHSRGSIFDTEFHKSFSWTGPNYL
jgi:hypothetical protein